jgi:hypothetical protein
MQEANQGEPKVATNEQVQEIVRPETAEPKVLKVGDREVSIIPLAYRWQSLFWKYALPMYEAELGSSERILKAIAAQEIAFLNIGGEITDGELDAIERLPRAAAVLLASKVEGAAKDPEAQIAREIEWLKDNSNIQEMRALVDAQQEKERMVQRVGERSPARFVWLLNLAGLTDVTPDSLTQLLTSLLSKLQETPAGDGA